VTPRSAHHILVLSALTVTLIACKSRKDGPDAPPPSAPLVLRIHAWEGYAREYAAQFEAVMRKQHRVNVTLQVTVTSGLDSFIRNIRDRGVHLISPANDLIAPLVQLNLIREIDTTRITRYRQINPIILDRHPTVIGGRIYAVPFSFGPYALAYNREKVPKPTSYKVLWDPRYRKRVTISGEYDTANIYMTALMLGSRGKNLFDLDAKKLKLVEDRLADLLRTQVVELWKGNLNPEGRERFDLGTDWGIGVSKINREHNGNWGFVVPDEGVTAWVDSWAVTRNVDSPELTAVAYAFINFMISPRIQARMAGITSYGPVNPYAGRYLSAEEKKRFYIADPQFFDKCTLWQPLKPEVLERYRKAWDNAKRRGALPK